VSDDDTTDELGALTLSYDDVRRERERLRDARAGLTRQLGPLPVSAGIAVSLVAAFSEDGVRGPLWIAFALFLLLILVSILYSSMRPYRQLRAAKEEGWRAGLRDRYPDVARTAQDQGLQVEDLLSERDWYAAMLRLEREVYGDPRLENRPGLPTRELQDLQDGLDRERTGLFLVQLLFGLVIASLLLSRLLA
jgi:hypothetical protein